MKNLFSNTSDIIFFLFLILFPFSYKEITDNWLIILFVLLVFLIFLQLFHKRFFFDSEYLGIVYIMLLMIIFGFIEKVNFSQYLNITLNSRIPFSTLLLTVGILTYQIKFLTKEKQSISIHSFGKYLFITSAFLFLLMVLFYPFLHNYYQMRMDSNTQLLNHILKYLMVFILAMGFISDRQKQRQINFGLILSLGTIIVLKILM